MNPLVADLLQILSLKQVTDDCFEGEGRDPGHHRLYGGHVLAQALTAAYRTIEARQVHSLHAYFLRAGDPTARAPALSSLQEQSLEWSYRTLVETRSPAAL